MTQYNMNMKIDIVYNLYIKIIYSSSMLIALVPCFPDFMLRISMTFTIFSSSEAKRDFSIVNWPKDLSPQLTTPPPTPKMLIA